MQPKLGRAGKDGVGVLVREDWGVKLDGIGKGIGASSMVGERMEMKAADCGRSRR